MSGHLGIHRVREGSALQNCQLGSTHSGHASDSYWATTSSCLFPSLTQGLPRVPERAPDWEPDLASGLNSAVPSQRTRIIILPFKTHLSSCLPHRSDVRKELSLCLSRGSNPDSSHPSWHPGACPWPAGSGSHTWGLRKAGEEFLWPLPPLPG